MDKPSTLSICCAAPAALALHAQAHAQTMAGKTPSVQTTTSSYIDTAWGVAFGHREIDDSASGNDEPVGRAAKGDARLPLARTDRAPEKRTP